MRLGLWGERVEYADGLSVADTIANALADGHCGKTDTAGITAAYRAAIDAALPAGVELREETFYGPAELAELDLNSIICSIDFYAIVASFDSEEISA